MPKILSDTVTEFEDVSDRVLRRIFELEVSEKRLKIV
jgi:hypothetical protein